MATVSALDLARNTLSEQWQGSGYALQREAFVDVIVNICSTSHLTEKTPAEAGSLDSDSESKRLRKNAAIAFNNILEKQHRGKAPHPNASRMSRRESGSSHLPTSHSSTITFKAFWKACLADEGFIMCVQKDLNCLGVYVARLLEHLAGLDAATSSTQTPPHTADARGRRSQIDETQQRKLVQCVFRIFAVNDAMTIEDFGEFLRQWRFAGPLPSRFAKEDVASNRVVREVWSNAFGNGMEPGAAVTLRQFLKAFEARSGLFATPPESAERHERVRILKFLCEPHMTRLESRLGAEMHGVTTVESAKLQTPSEQQANSARQPSLWDSFLRTFCCGGA